MLGVLSGLVSWGNNIGDILQNFSDLGIFSYVLPFLIVFALVFGILSATKMFGESRGVNTVISVAVGLMSLVGGYVPSFFQVIFPYAGVGMSILLVMLILMGLFVSGNERGWFIAFFVIGALVALIVVLSALSSYRWFGGDWWGEYWPAIITASVIIGLVILVIFGTKKSPGSGGEPRGQFVLAPWRS